MSAAALLVKRCDRSSSRDRRRLLKKPSQRWSMDFVRDTLASGRPFRTLNVLDEFTREAVAIEVAASIPGERVTRVLDRAIDAYGVPFEIIIDNGPEFTGRALDQWAYKRGVKLHFIRPGKPMDNGYCEGKYRDEFLNDNWFESIDEAAEKAEAWRVDYNEQRPHQGLRRRTPAEVRADYERGSAALGASGSGEGTGTGALLNAGDLSQSDAQ